ncbi:hypothetical protein [Novosphingobium nitrogenifigens]|uniref:hypothetical protein n=1 Tax=Novosphingobium nitrogenifigens TaxID=378548 RepID=UPI0012F4D30F|nr:hypothetical protein [Novosphingobium nitrogenifigens]
MELADYLERIVDPTFADFRSNPRSGRHAFLACVAVFHAVDRAAHPRKASTLRQEWRKRSFDFLLVDMVAHHFKHVQSYFEKQPTLKNKIPLHCAIFNKNKIDEESMGLDLHNIYFAIRDAITFIKKQSEN